MRRFASDILDHLSSENFILATFVCFGFLIFITGVSFILVTSFGSYGPPFYNPFWNISVYNPLLYDVLTILGYIIMFLLLLLFTILGILVFVFAVVIKRNSDVS